MSELRPNTDTVAGAWEIQERAQTGAVAPSTLRRQRFLLKHLEDYFGGTPVSTVSSDYMARYRLSRISDGARPAEINMEVSLAIRLILASGGAAVRLTPLRAERPDVGVALSERQRDSVFTWPCDFTWPCYEMLCLVRLALATGMRANEIRTLGWEDVSLATRAIELKRSKTAAGRRTIPINDRAMAALQCLRQLHPHSNRITSYRDWDRAWARVKSELALPEGLRFHDLRHTAITVLYEAGAPEGVIQAIVGHVDPRVTRRYSHVRAEARRQAMEHL